jgi:hypothetical protein
MADAEASKASVRKGVRVRVPLRARDVSWPGHERGHENRLAVTDWSHVTPAAPWWDASWLNDILLIVGFAVAAIIYGATQHTGTQQQRRSTLNHLNGVKAAMSAWGDSYFNTAYEGAGLHERIKEDRDLVLGGQYMQNFMVPIQPVEGLVEPPGDSWPLEPRTVEAAGAALHRMVVFNQLVQQQTDFHALHAAEYKDPEVPKKPLAEAAENISRHLHGGVIGDREWYIELSTAIDANIKTLEDMLRMNRPKRHRPWLQRLGQLANRRPRTGARTGPL